MIHGKKAETFYTEFEKSPISVFCVEAEIDVLHIVVLSLQLDTGITVQFTGDPDDALRTLMRQNYRPDCILLDSVMPSVNGELLLGEIRALPYHRETPVIFLTGHVRSADRQRYVGLGACGTISKPFDPIGLAQQVRSLLATVGPSNGSNVT